MNSSRLFVLELTAAFVAFALGGCWESVSKPKTVDDFVEAAAQGLASGDLAAAKIAVTNAYALAANDVDVRLLKAQVDFHNRDYASAIKLFKGVAEDMKLDRKLRAEGWVGLGVTELCNNDRDAARLDCLSALRLDGKNAAAWYHLGYIYQNDYKYHEAASDCFEVYVRLETNNVDKVLKAQRTYLPALREERTNVILEIPGARTPDRAACTKALQAAEAAMKKGTFKTAKLRYEEAIKADPTSAPAAVGLAKVLLHTDATAEGKKRALEYYCRACRLNPSSVATFTAAASLAVSLGNHLTARELYSRALAADRTNISVLDGLIRALRKTNQAKTAAAYQRYREFLGKKVK